MPRRKSPLPLDPVASAVAAGLRYIHDTQGGIARKRSGKGWRYLSADGNPIRDQTTILRIRSLVIPPAWTGVWISPSANTHLQAIGYDARGRKQYKYHPLYSQIRNNTKFSRLTAFAKLLPGIRERIHQDLAKAGLPREKVLGAVTQLLQTTYIRVGNQEYARENNSFGLTTMQSRHVEVDGATVQFHFRGKSGKEHQVELHDRRLARIIRDCGELPGRELFQYVDGEGATHKIHSEDVNGYIHAVAGDTFSAKDFRTWAATFLAAQQLVETGPAQSETEAKRVIVGTVKAVAESLGNRPATCRKYYIHPVVLEAYADGRLFECVKAGVQPDEDCVRRLVDRLAS